MNIDESGKPDLYERLLNIVIPSKIRAEGKTRKVYCQIVPTAAPEHDVDHLISLQTTSRDFAE